MNSARNFSFGFCRSARAKSRPWLVYAAISEMQIVKGSPLIDVERFDVEADARACAEACTADAAEWAVRYGARP